MKVVYMGTPEFAVPPLRALADQTLLAVFCQPDRPKGRSGKPQPCPVKQVALELGVPVHQPRRIRARKWVALLRELAPDLIVVAAFGQLLPQSILDIPTIDCINLHASLLPRWRGASPIHHAILEGDRETGVAVMKMLKELDAGPVYSEARTEIRPEEGRVALEERLAKIGADLLHRSLPLLTDLEPRPQGEQGLTYAPIISKDFGRLDAGTMDAARIARMTRALEGWPQVQCTFRDQPLKILTARALEQSTDAAPGTIVSITRKQLLVACAGGSVLSVESVQPPGKKPQPVAAFINGYKPTEGELLT